MKYIKYGIALVLSFVTVLSAAFITFASESTDAADTSVFYESGSSKDYEKYLADAGQDDSQMSEVSTDLSKSKISGSGIEIKEEGLIWKGNSGSAGFSFNVVHSGSYNIYLKYENLSSNNFSKISFDIEVNGQQLFNSMGNVTLPRWFKPGKIIQDSRGNDIAEDLTVSNETHKEYIYVSDSYYDEPMQLYLTSGLQTITFYGDCTDIILKEIMLVPIKDYDSYENTYKKWMSQGIKIADEKNIKVQGENAVAVSDTNLIPTTDRSDSLTEPNHSYELKLNTIGAASWKNARETICWSVEVPSEGLYTLSFKARQNQKDGFVSFRRLYINGEVPFEECNCIDFKYAGKWYIQTVGNGEEPYYFHLKKGLNTISLETVSGNLSSIAREVNSLVAELNDIYSQIIIVVGTTPDKYRVYDLPNEIPGIMDKIKSSLESLKKVKQQILDEGVTLGSEMTVFDNLSSLLNLYIEDTEKIPRKLSSLKSYITDLSTWSYNAVEQPLEIDYFLVSGSEGELPKANSGFFEKLSFEFMKLIASFCQGYGVVGDTKESSREIIVWMVAGREQLSILKDLISSDFVNTYGISVDLAIMQADLSKAIMAGKAPDVALFAANDFPVNLAYRNSVVDLTQFKDFEEVAERFMPNSLNPYKIGESCYALPATQTFEVMFIRNDIFQMLGLEVPSTWDEFYNILPVLQFNNFEIGIPSGNSTFTTLLGQNGLKLYNETKTATDIYSEKAGAVFSEWTEFYTKYDFPVSYNFYNRFRSGEMPIGISSYTLAAELSVLAPEIRGLWSMYSLPGIVGEDNELHNGTSPLGTDSGTCAMILNDGKRGEDAWTFLKWFLSDDIQADYGNRIEAQLGVSARYATSNIEAFKRLAWSASDRDFLLSEWEKSCPTEIVAGNYYVTRHLNNAFRAVVYDREAPIHIIKQYAEKIDSEIERKLNEFSLD